MSSSRRLPSADAGICLVLAAVTIAYLRVWPRDFFAYDEGLYLYESRRLLEGAVPYRDFFELITPGAYYFMALVFRFFGVTMTAARMGMAALHAAIILLIFLTCRRLGVRRLLAVAAAVLHLAVSYVAMTMANPHWFGTALTLLVLYLCLVLPRESPRPSLLSIGLAVGALGMVQQQKGAVITLAVCVVLVADQLLAGRASPDRRGRLLTRFATFVAGVALIVVPSMVFLLLTAGPGPLWESLIEIPLRDYAGFRQCGEWGALMIARPVYCVAPSLTSNLPFIVAPGVVRLAWKWLRGADPHEARPLLVLCVFIAAATASIWYCPNFTHLAIIAPVGFILLAETIEAALAAAPLQRLVSPAAALASVGLIAFLAVQMQRNLELRRKVYRYPHDSEAGVVDFRNVNETVLLQGVLDHTNPGDEIFAYPTYPGIYFLTGTTNPTRYQILVQGYNPLEQFHEAIATLEERQVGYVVFQAGPRSKTDPFRDYFGRNYRGVRLPYAPGRFPGFALLQRVAPPQAQATP